MTTPRQDGQWEYDALLKQADAWSTTGFGSTDPPLTVNQPPVPNGLAGLSPPARMRHPSGGPSRTARHSRGQGLSWASLMVVLTASGALAWTLYSTLDSINFLAPRESYGRASHGLDLALISLGGALIGLIMAVIALAHARPKLMATCTFVLALALPFVSGAVALKFGINALVFHAGVAADELGTSTLPLVNELLSSLGLDPEPFQNLIKRIFG